MKLFVYSCSQNQKRHADPIVPPGVVQEAALAAGKSHRQSRLWAGLLRAQALLPALPADSEELHDDDQHEGLTSAPPPPGVASLQVGALALPALLALHTAVGVPINGYISCRLSTQQWACPSMDTLAVGCSSLRAFLL